MTITSVSLASRGPVVPDSVVVLASGVVVVAVPSVALVSVAPVSEVGVSTVLALEIVEPVELASPVPPPSPGQAVRSRAQARGRTR